VYQAYFQQGQNIGDSAVLLSLAAAVGLDPEQVQHHLRTRTYAARIQSSQQEARALGVSGVPTFIVGPAQIVGAQAPEVFVKMLNRIVERGLA
jgi:predicted DsbA family dithiol-disulfide isomerase